MLSEANALILRKLPKSEHYTKPGVYCNNPKITTFQGVIYHYQQPADMQEAFCVLVDRFNSLYIQSDNKILESEKLLGVFKSIAWLIF